MSLLGEDFYKELANTHIFPTLEFGHKDEREIQISSSRHFNQVFLNYNQKWESVFYYIFLTHLVLQELQLNSQIKIAVMEAACSVLTAGMCS